MKYVLSIDWLSLFCLYMGTDLWSPVDGDFFTYHKENYGTRSFSQFWRVRMPNDEGGVDDFAEIQAVPYSSILPEYAIIVRFCNRSLYLPNFGELGDRLFRENLFQCEGISRIDICADFNDFATISPKALIEGFAAKKLRHVGRGVGALYFNHGKGVEHDEFGHKKDDYGVCYNGLSFGQHSSDTRVYLYNKSFELMTQGDKPWIRDTWINAGLDILNVWRLEVSIKRSGLKFKDKRTGNEVQIDTVKAGNPEELDKIYRCFVQKLFSFVRNRSGITNISREPRLKLFDEKPCYDRGVIRNLSSGDRMEKILIKNLHQLADRYRGAEIYGADDAAKHLASCLAYATDLHDWYAAKVNKWEKPIHK